MTTQPKISCITITHNRVNMLARSMKCFEEQTYANKESVILFTADDQETPDFAEASTQYRHIHLIQKDPSEDIILEAEAGEETPFESLESGDKVRLRRHGSGEYLTVDGAEVFVLERQGEEISLKAENGQWLVFSENEALKLQAESKSLSTVFLVDGRTKLLLPSLENARKMEQLGFEVKVENKGNEDNVTTLVQLFEVEKVSLGGKRNLCVEMTNGEFVCVWDDDDWYDAKRLEHQMQIIDLTGKDVCAMAHTILMDHHTKTGYLNAPRMDGWEQTILVRKSVMGYYGNKDRGEDTPLLKRLYAEDRISIIDDPWLYIYNIHTGRGNTSSATHFKKMIREVMTEPLSEEENQLILEKLGEA